MNEHRRKFAEAVSAVAHYEKSHLASSPPFTHLAESLAAEKQSHFSPPTLLPSGANGRTTPNVARRSIVNIPGTPSGPTLMQLFAGSTHRKSRSRLVGSFSLCGQRSEAYCCHRAVHRLFLTRFPIAHERHSTIVGQDQIDPITMGKKIDRNVPTYGWTAKYVGDVRTLQ